ncbi:MAG: NnrU family protein [Rhizobiaceae bacterium]
MIWLILGLALWVVLHFIPSLGIGFRTSLREKFGAKNYQMWFSIGVVLSIVLMVIGWRSADQEFVYEPPEWGAHIGMLLVLLGFIFFGLSHAKTNLKQYVRHPQLTGLIMWAIGHLLANGDNLSVILFGTLGVWALVEIPLINRREGAWVKPEKVPLSAEIRPVVTGLIVFTVFFLAHPYLFGVSPIPY